MSFQAKAIDITLDVVVADNVPPVVHLDSEKVAWTVTTLVGNALRYVQSRSRRLPGGTISVRTTYDQASSEMTIEVKESNLRFPVAEATRQAVYSSVPRRITSPTLK